MVCRSRHRNKAMFKHIHGLIFCSKPQNQPLLFYARLRSHHVCSWNPSALAPFPFRLKNGLVKAGDIEGKELPSQLSNGRKRKRSKRYKYSVNSFCVCRRSSWGNRSPVLEANAHPVPDSGLNEEEVGPCVQETELSYGMGMSSYPSVLVCVC